MNLPKDFDITKEKVSFGPAPFSQWLTPEQFAARNKTATVAGHVAVPLLPPKPSSSPSPSVLPRQS